MPGDCNVKDHRPQPIGRALAPAGRPPAPSPGRARFQRERGSRAPGRAGRSVSGLRIRRYSGPRGAAGRAQWTLQVPLLYFFPDLRCKEEDVDPSLFAGAPVLTVATTADQLAILTQNFISSSQEGRRLLLLLARAFA